MKKLLLVLCISLLSFQAKTEETPGDGRFGLGLQLGFPTAITGKYWVNNTDAFDVAISFSSNYYTLIYGDYLWHFPRAFKENSKFISQLMPYVGVGLGFYSWSSGYYYKDRPSRWRDSSTDLGVYARVPFGIEWYPVRPPLGIYVELAPGIAVSPGLWINFDFGIGGRFYF
ncbi:MAG: hypothetical protein SGI74_01035 [Oligoflexia bacterium]|nr:hypothetical protein [Oligoflexia bacterium]